MALTETPDTSAIVLQLDSAGRALLSVEQARVTLGGISTSSLYKLLNDGVIPAVRLGGRTMVSVADVAALVATQRQNPVPPRVLPWDRAGQMERRRWPRRDAVDAVEERGAAPVKAPTTKRPALKRRAGR